MLIRNAQLHFDPAIVDVRIDRSVIAGIAPTLAPRPGESVIHAHGAALLPGLHDHHLHLQALAASLNSIGCGPPSIGNEDDLIALLQLHAAAAPGDWLRGTGYHQSVAGNIDRTWLDRHVSQRPVRIQHRSGRLWILNTAALERLDVHGANSPLEREGGRLTGRLYDGDGWLRERLAGQRPSLLEASRLLAGRGVTGITEVTPTNSLDDYRHFGAAQDRGELLQTLLVMGGAGLDHAGERDNLQRGGTKIHLHETSLPEFDALAGRIAGSHAVGRPVAIHCVTTGELVFALECLAAAGAHAGDRIEHASIALPEYLSRMRELGITVATQPNFIWERGDQYLRDLPVEHISWLYRARSLVDAGIALGGGTDAPFGAPDPWRAMQTAVDRRTRYGEVLGSQEALSPEAACDLFTGPPRRPGERPAALSAGMRADLCLIDRSWNEARDCLAATRVLTTICNGTVIWQSPADVPRQRSEPKRAMNGGLS